MKSATGRLQDRTYTSIMEEYLRALPPGTAVSCKMLIQHGIPERIANTYMHFFVKWGVAKRVVYPESVPKKDRVPKIIYTPHSDRRSAKVEWKVQEGEGGRPNARKKRQGDDEVPYVTANGRSELKVVEPPAPPPEPERVRLDDLTLNEVREGFKLLLREFGLNLYRKGDQLSLEP